MDILRRDERRCAAIRRVWPSSCHSAEGSPGVPGRSARARVDPVTHRASAGSDSRPRTGAGRVLRLPESAWGRRTRHGSRSRARWSFWRNRSQRFRHQPRHGADRHRVRANLERYGTARARLRAGELIGIATCPNNRSPEREVCCGCVGQPSRVPLCAKEQSCRSRSVRTWH